MKPHVLIIEDDPSIADLQKDYLEINDMTVTIEHDGKKGLEAALNEPFDLIILDVMLPTMDGFEIIFLQISNSKKKANADHDCFG